MRAAVMVCLVCLWLISLPPFFSLEGDFLLFQREMPTGTPTIAPTVAILSPLAGQAVQGRLPVIVFSAVEGFVSGELSFGYANDQTGTWFLIAQNPEPVVEGEIGAWDTNLISDGNYNLRFVVFLQDGSKLETTVQGLRVRNYSLIETNTPTPVTPTATLSPDERPTVTATLVPTVTATATLLPTNQAEMTNDQITKSLSKGALVAVALFVVLGFYILARIKSGKGQVDGSG